MKHKGFYKPIKGEENKAEEEVEVVDRVTNNRANKGKTRFEAEIKLKGFKVRVPTLALA